MAKKSCIEKAQKKKRLITKFATKRAELKKAMANPELDFEAKINIQKQLESLPLNSCKVRDRNRCWLTGRPRGYHRDLGVCRNALRLMAHQGMVPGMTKASW
ncbi:MAG: 30S ribosomal protein S14 [Cyanobacteria bacterium]|nr:30S ribosomal protein S14 [Cyanobacteriota bacterium]MDA1020949.1 30S ribosomal protein S14 [Cyanobacteriota bacterium]